jgi:hypothetical protein
MAGKYQAFDPNSEAIGSSLLGFIQCIRSKDIGPYLEKHGLTNIDPNGWYPVQTWLDVLSDLAEERPGQVMFDFVSVGMAVAAVIPLPEEYYASLPFEEALLASGGSGYKRNHRGDAGRRASHQDYDPNTLSGRPSVWRVLRIKPPLSAAWASLHAAI